MKHLSQFFIEKLNIQAPVLESGASGHMLHPHDVNEFTGVDIEELIKKVFGGEIEGMTEKMDGFGIQASMNRDGEVVFIRNKGNLNSKKGGMTIDDFPSHWDDNPHALENYTKGAKIIEAVFKKVGKEWFNPNSTTRRVVNCECILEGTTNTIPYASDQVDFHNIWIYEKQESDSEWKNTEVTKRGLDVIEKACEGIDNVQLTPQVIIKYNDETERLKEKWLKAWNEFLKKYDCSEEMTIEAIKFSLFFQWADVNAPWLTDDYKAAQDCCRRWIFGDKKSANLKDLKAIYQDHLDEFNKIEKSPSKVANAVCFPLQKFFYGMGADVVRVTSGLVNAGRDDVVKSLLKDLKDATEKIKREGSSEDNDFLQTWMGVLDEIGEENLASAEGVVFSYKGKMMKFTGGFVPLNRIIGYSKYTMKPKSLQESLFDDDLVTKELPTFGSLFEPVKILTGGCGDNVNIVLDVIDLNKLKRVSHPSIYNVSRLQIYKGQDWKTAKLIKGNKLDKDNLDKISYIMGFFEDMLADESAIEGNKGTFRYLIMPDEFNKISKKCFIGNKRESEFFISPIITDDRDIKLEIENFIFDHDRGGSPLAGMQYGNHKRITIFYKRIS